jgi:chromosomal replication initiator protein
VLRRLVREAGIEISDRDALGALAERVDSNIRQLHGALTRAMAHASMRATPLDPDLIAEVFPSSLQRSAAPTIESVQLTVAARSGLQPADLTGPSRSAAPLRARQIAIYLSREMTSSSMPEIGRAFGGRDHSTVLNSIRRIEERAATDPVMRRDLDQFRQAINNPGEPVP